MHARYPDNYHPHSVPRPPLLGVEGGGSGAGGAIELLVWVGLSDGDLLDCIALKLPDT